jgi:large subunit ribosomal protein L18
MVYRMARRSRENSRLKRKKRIRKKVTGTPERPRLTVFRSLKHVYAQVIDDCAGETRASASTLSPEVSEHVGKERRAEMAKRVGRLVAVKALEKGIKKVVFDRGGYLYHGSIKMLAEGAREGGLEF